MAAGFDAVLDEQGIGPRVKTKARAGQGAKHDIGHGDVVIAAITSCTKHVQPKRHVGRGVGCAKCRCARAKGQAMGENLAGARFAGRNRVFEKSRFAEIAERAGL